MSAKKSESDFTPQERMKLIGFVEQNTMLYDGRRNNALERERLWNEISRELQKSGACGSLVCVSCLSKSKILLR